METGILKRGPNLPGIIKVKENAGLDQAVAGEE